MDNFIDNISYSDDDTLNAIKTLLGSVFIICIMLCCVCSLYKYAVCQENKNKLRSQRLPQSD